MALPYKRIPAGIAGFTSPTGKLPAAQLSHVSGVGDFQLQAARSMRALCAAAAASDLIVASVGDYRSYDEQVNLFKSRYVHGRNNNNTDRFWHSGVNGGDDQWWKLVTGAPCAEPGTSNHGLGLANDYALNVNGNIVTLDTKVNGVSLWDWLNAFGRNYGWSWGETTSERWHWVYIEGDVIPGAVLTFEAAHNWTLDYSFWAPDVKQLDASGIAGVCRYVGDFTRSKVISKAEFDSLKAQGLGVALVFEDAIASWQGGYDRGKAYGLEARTNARLVGWPDARPIYLAVDDNIMPGDLPTVVQHMQGFVDAQNLGPQGVYGTGFVIDQLTAKGLVRWGWQSMSTGFYGNQNVTGNAALRQTTNHPLPQFAPEDYDQNDIKKPDWGQVPAPQGVDVPLTQADADLVVRTLLTGGPNKITVTVPHSGGPSTEEQVETILGYLLRNVAELVVAQANGVAKPLLDTIAKVTTDVNKHTDQAVGGIVIPPPSGGGVDWSKVHGHQPSQGDIDFTVDV